MILKEEARVNLERLTEFRTMLHRYPELSNQESETADRVVQFLKETGPDEIRTGIGGHGVAALYGKENDGPTLLFRCELDALPIREANTFDYRSRTEGVAHLCGHDGHMTIVAGLAMLLGDQPPDTGRVILLYQPAEETGEGAARILDDEQFRDIAPDYVFALHNLPGYEKGQIVLRNGVFASASRGLTIRLHGTPSHAAHPADGRNPALAASQIVQSIVAVPQMYTELHAGTLVTPIHVQVGGPAFGTSPGEGVVMATLRSHTPEDMNILVHRTVEIAQGIASAFELETEVSWCEEFEAVVNDAACVDVVRETAGRLGLEVHEALHPFPWSEDFGHFTSRYPGVLFGLGSGTDQPQLHNDTYDFPDDIIETGVRMFRGIMNNIINS